MNRIAKRVLWARPGVLVLAGLAAGLVNPGLQPGLLLEGMIAFFALPTLALAALARGPRLARPAWLGSTVLALLAWALFATLTGGVGSPLVVGFLLEILLVVLSSTPRDVFGATAGVLLLMVGMASIQGFDALGLLAVESAFVGVTGGIGAAMARRRLVGEAALRSQGEELGQRLEALQRELEDERVISRVGENVARLAHGLKNAVHSLRGFVSLIEPRLEQGPGTNAALAGLHAAIDDLEKLARLTLADGAEEPEQGAAGAEAALPARTPANPVEAGVAAVVNAARTEVEAASPGVRWEVAASEEGRAAQVALERASLLELLVILMRNAVEAMSGEGAARVELRASDSEVLFSVQDDGPGFPEEVLARDFEPGYTTKETGSGFGLFLARRIVDDQGGALQVANRPEGGAQVEVSLPRIDGD